MNKLLLLLLTTLSLTPAVRAAQVPYMPEIDDRFKKAEVVKMLKVVFNPSYVADQGLSGTSAGIHSLGVSLPANAVILNSFGVVKTQVVGSGSTVGLQCEDSLNILGATDLTGKSAGNIFAGKQYNVDATAAASGATASGLTGAIAADCNISAVTTAHDVTAGKVDFFIEYVVAD